MRLPLSLRLARRELRGGIKGFRIFLLCLTLGVGAIAGVGSLSEALVGGLNADAQRLLGGDVSLRLSHRPATAAQLAYLQAEGEISRIVEMRAMAHAEGGERTLVELKGIDDRYPLYGAMSLDGDGGLHDLLGLRDGVWGAVAEANLLSRLKVGVGDKLRVGDLTYQVRAAILREPDRGADAFVLGPRLMVARDSLAHTGLITEGSMIRYKYKVRLPGGTAVPAWTAALGQRFPKAGWRVRDVRNGAPGLRSFVERMRIFLTLVGLTALLVGGLGIANAVKSYLDGKTGTIATLKCLGAPAGLIFRAYFAQVLALAFVGVVLGLVLGAGVPLLLADLLARYLPFEARIGLYPGALALAAVYGLVTAVAFTLWPLARSREVAPGALFRDVAAPMRGRPRAIFIAATILAFALLAGLAIFTTENQRFAVWFVIGAAGSMLLFYGAANAIMDVTRRLPRPRRPGLRLALANLHRPGASTVSVVLSFGLGLTVLVVVGLLEGNLGHQVNERIPDQAPAFFFIDIQPQQAAEFDAIVAATDGASGLQRVPMLRGRITAVNGVDVGAVTASPDTAWVLRGDRGLTYTAHLPAGADIIAGAWWPEDYAGPPLISFDAHAAEGLGVGVGDSLTINVLGREISATIANLRHVDWATFGINFVIIFAPGALEAAPHSFIATAHAEEAAEGRLLTAITDRFANVTAIRVREALEALNLILANIGVAIRATASITLVAGVLVLAGAIAASHRRRVYDAVMLKVLGATRLDIFKIYAAEYALLGLVTAALAALVGSIAAYVVVTEIMAAPWVWLPQTVVATALLSLVITLILGLVGTWVALSQRPAPLLRNE